MAEDNGTVEYAEYRVECASGEPHNPALMPFDSPRWAIFDAAEADRIQRMDPEMPQCGPHHVAQRTVTRTPWQPIAADDAEAAI